MEIKRIKLQITTLECVAHATELASALIRLHFVATANDRS